MQIAFVTVAHAADEWMLRIQARSMRTYLPPSLLGEIIVVENFDRGREVDWRDRLRAEYGHLAPLVRFVSAPALGSMPQAAGWWTQQVLKLTVARTVTCARYVLLDAKNHLVRPLARDFLELPDGRMRTRRYGYERHPLRGALERTLTFCGVDPGSRVRLFPTTATPFIVTRADVLETIDHVETRENRPLPEVMIDRQLTEFFLIAGRLDKRGRLETRYEFGQQACPVLWHTQSEPHDVLAAVREADERGAPVFAIHRAAVSRLGDTSTEILAQFWKRRGLFQSTAAATAEIKRVQAAL